MIAQVEADIVWLATLADQYPLAAARLWDAPYNGRLTPGCSTQRAIVRDVLRPEVDVSIWRGGVRSGKTIAALQTCVAYALGGDHPAVEAWCAANGLANTIPAGPGDTWVAAIGSNDSLRIHRRTVRDLLPRDGVSTYNVGNKGEARLEVQVGGRVGTIWFRSVEQGEDAYQGATVRVVYFDEELHDPRWRGVVRQSTMRVGADPVKLILSYAPKHGRIWIDEDYLDSGATHVRVHAIAALDNPHLRGEARAQLERTFAAMSPRERAAMSEGRALPREELVWPDWDPSVHLVDPPDPTGPGGCPADWPRYVGADFGYQSGNVVLWGALSPDGVLYVYRELYTVGWTGRANGLEAVRLSGSERIRKGWGDSSRPETIAEYQACGLPLGKADKGLEGLGAVAERLSGPALLDTCSECGGTGCGACDGSGRVVIRRGAPTLRVVRGTCPELTREIPGYVWEPGREQPRKRDDHACDALRYLVVGLGRRPAAPPVLGSRLSGLVRQSPWRNM